MNGASRGPEGQSAPTFREGDAFGDYRVVRLLGRGGMGEVWLLKARDCRLLAAKVLDPESARDPAMRKRFLREGEMVLGVRHLNLVETYEVGEDRARGICYILMEYVPGGTLEERLAAKGALPVADALALVRALAGVLELAREKNIVHRDIKPANIMFGEDGSPKLADLGIARDTRAVDTTTVTQTGMMVGTPAYMAPEQMVDAHAVDGRADIYSLGVVLYEMLAGERPHKDDTAVQLMARAIKGEPLPDVRTVRPEIPASVAQLIGMMTAKNAANRIASPKRLAEYVAQIEGGATFLRVAPVVERRTAALPARLQTPGGPPTHVPQRPSAGKPGIGPQANVRKPPPGLGKVKPAKDAPRGGRARTLLLLLLLAGAAAYAYVWYFGWPSWVGFPGGWGKSPQSEAVIQVDGRLPQAGTGSRGGVTIREYRDD